MVCVTTQMEYPFDRIDDIYPVVEYTKNGQYFRYTRCIKLAFSDFDFKIIILN